MIACASGIGRPSAPRIVPVMTETAGRWAAAGAECSAAATSPVAVKRRRSVWSMELVYAGACGCSTTQMEREAREERVVGGSRRDAPVVQHVVGHVVVDPPLPLVILRFLSAEEDQLVVHAGAPARVLEEPR